MKRLSLALLVALSVVLAVAGCGGGHRATLPHCNPADYAMNCVRPGGQRAHLATTAVAQGIDFAWSCPSPSGHGFGASYLSTDPSKNWTRGCVNAWHAAGAKTVAVWETSAMRAAAGFAAGQSDARAAAAQAAALGEPSNRPIDFAIDFDAAGPEVLSYFQGVHSVLGPRDDAYGGYRPLLYLSGHGVVGHQNWQTYAWSGGAWLPASIAPLEQYLNGSAVDLDRAIAADYGQWPYAAPPTFPLCFSHRIPAKSCAAVKAKIASDERAAASSERALTATSRILARNHCVKPYRRGVCIHKGRDAQVFAQRARWFTAAADRLKAAS